MITGATGGIGRSIALSLAALGWDLLLTARRADVLEAVAKEARAGGAGSVRTVAADLGVAESCTHLADTLGGAALHLVVHSAAAFSRQAFAESSADVFTALLAVNVVAPFMLTQRLLKNLMAAHGQIVFMNSSAGVRAAPDLLQYSASKHALRGVADAMRVELNEHGIRVLSVYCGRVATAMQEQNCLAEGRPYQPDQFLQPYEVAQAVVNAVSLPPTTELTDLHIRPSVRGY